MKKYIYIALIPCMLLLIGCGAKKQSAVSSQQSEVSQEPEEPADPECPCRYLHQRRQDLGESDDANRA